MTELKLTQLGNSYWDQTGAYQNEFHKLTKELMPSCGSANTLHGELIRACNRLVHEHCNNGNCNAFDGDEGGIDDFYNQFLRLINVSVPGANKYTNMIFDIIFSDLYNDDETNFSDNNMKAYANMCDVVVHYILNNDDSDLPSWYKRD